MGTTTKPGRRGGLTQLFCLPQAFCNGVFVNFEQKCHISHINASEALSTKEFHCFHHSLHPSRHLSHISHIFSTSAQIMLLVFALNYQNQYPTGTNLWQSVGVTGEICERYVRD